jgi:H+/Cl- antiporter ClcA/CBS domain-containing protein
MLSRIQIAWKRRNERAKNLYMVCPYCHQWGLKGRCLWCGFNAVDSQTVAALTAQRVREQEEARLFWNRLIQPFKNIQKRREQFAQANYMVCPQCHQWGKRGICLWCGFNALDELAIAQLRSEDARARAEFRAKRRQVYQAVSGLFHVDANEQWATAKMIAKWSVLSSVVGVLAGTASAVFLTALQWATAIRIANPEILFLLPVVGFFVGWLYNRFAGTAARGNNLVIEEVNTSKEPIPVKMAPLVLLGTVLTHLVGGSAGREGTAIQMGSSLADWLQRRLGLSPKDRRMMLMAGISGGFGSVFGTPIAGFVFGLEVQSVGQLNYEGILPCLIAAIVGDLVTRAWGITHVHYPALLNLELDPGLILKVMIAGIVFGLTSLLFIELTHGIKQVISRLFHWTPLRPAVGGLLIMGLILVVGSQDYLGLSLPLIQHSLDGTGVVVFAFLFKLIFTAVTLGSGFVGGEVTPLFVIGSTLGYTLGRLLGIDPGLMASIGFVAVFAGASNTPLACALMGMELFGGGSTLYLILGTFIAYLASGHRSIYITQRVGVPKIFGLDIRTDEKLEAVAERRFGWLPQLPSFSKSAAQRPVRAVMSPDPIAVTWDMPIQQVVELAIREGVRTLPVLDDKGLVIGIITDNDLLRRSKLTMRLSLMAGLSSSERSQLLRDTHHQRAADIMTSPAITAIHTERLSKVESIMTEHDLKRVPVVDTAGHLLGMVTRSDLLRELTFSDSVPTWTVEGQDVQMGWNDRVEQVMYHEVSIVEASMPLSEVLQTMLNTAQKRIVVVDPKQHILGLITDSDLLFRAHINHRAALLDTLPAVWIRQRSIPDNVFDPALQTAADIMTSPVITVNVGTTVRDALRLLMEHRIKRLPVLDSENHVVGLVGRAGLMRALLTKSSADVVLVPTQSLSRTA